MHIRTVIYRKLPPEEQINNIFLVLQACLHISLICRLSIRIPALVRQKCINGPPLEEGNKIKILNTLIKLIKTKMVIIKLASIILMNFVVASSVGKKRFDCTSMMVV